ncbi:MAG: prepilin-type N-terminal cleavage/methylation domain-containing protein [Candidatus Brocadiaceae bacterium]
MKYSHKNQGYTMIELVMVMVIIAILTGIILPVFLHGGLDEGRNTLQSSVFCAKTFATTKRRQCTLTLNANYYTTPNPSPCTFTIEDVDKTVKKLYQLPKYIRFWQYQVVGSGSESFISGAKTVYFEPHGIAHNTSGIMTPQDIIITLKDIKTGSTTSQTIIGNTCQIKR